MHWKLYVLKLAILSRFPLGNKVRGIKRKIFGYDLDRVNIDNTLSDLDRIEKISLSVGRSFVGSRVLEIGSGWFPVIPIMLSLRGSDHIILTDLTPHLDEVTFAAALEFLQTECGVSAISDRGNTLKDFGLTYIAPFRPDAVSDESIDFVISRAVLEHIPPDDILRILKQLRSKLSPNGLMIHSIDHSDHLEHRDKTISKINFLTWSTWKHKFVNWLTGEGENRLRHHEYFDLFERAGFDVIANSSELHKDTCDLAKKLPLKGRFAGMTAEQLSIVSSTYLLAPRKVPA